jgi:hypothetical protein
MGQGVGVRERELEREAASGGWIGNICTLPKDHEKKKERKKERRVERTLQIE